MAFIHFQGQFAEKTACGRGYRQPSTTTEYKRETTCPKCLERLNRKDTDYFQHLYKDMKLVNDYVTGPSGVARKIPKDDVVEVTVKQLRDKIQEALSEEEITDK
jgi:hypothetical protein